MNYFVNCKCVEELKKEYRELCFKYHPDVNKEANANEIMKQINVEYAKEFERLKNVFRNKAGEIYEDAKPVSETAEDFQEIIDKLISLEGITIELIGRWIWVTGNTKGHKEILKGLKFRWCKNKKAWSWHRPEEKIYNNKEQDLDEIRSKYRSTVFNNKSSKKKPKHKELEEKVS